MNDRSQFRRKRSESKALLERAVVEWRSAATAETLSDDARQTVLQAAFDRRDPIPQHRPLFSPLPRRILTGAVPLVLAAVTVMLFPERFGDPDSSVRLQATKSRDEVVFTIANGQRAHSVYKSSVPSSFDSSSRVPVRDGSFRDAVDDGSGLVFYRIE